MKKTLFLAIAVSAVITGCVRNETTNGNVVSDSKISFEAPAIAGITRGANVAGEISSPYPTTENFSVYARYFAGNYTTFAEGTSYMENIKTAYDNAGNYWDSEAAGGQAYYWPKNGTLTFAAYSPSGAAEDCTVAWGANGFSFTDFSVKADPAKHYDLMFSERSYNRNASTGGTTYNGVDITFKHALSSVVYKVKTSAEYEGHTITVTSIKLVNTFQTGTFNQNLADANDAMTTDAAAWSGQSNENANGYEAVTQNQPLTYHRIAAAAGARRRKQCKDRGCIHHQQRYGHSRAEQYGRHIGRLQHHRVRNGQALYLQSEFRPRQDHILARS